MRKANSLLLVATLVLTLLLPIYAVAEKPIEVYLNNTKLSLSVEPIIENNILLIPFKELFEKLGFDVYWDDYSNHINAYSDFTWLEFTPGSKDFIVENHELKFEVPTKVINGNTYVPLSFINTVAGKDVNWDNKTRTITINDSMLDGNISSSDAKTIFEKIRSLDIQNIKFSGNFSVYNRENDYLKSFSSYIDGETVFEPTITTHIKGSSYYEFLEMELDAFITDNQQYRRNFVSGQWIQEDQAYIDFDPLINFSNYVHNKWEKGIVKIESGLSYEGLNVKVTLSPDFYHKNVSPKVTNSPVTTVTVYFYNMDPKSFVPKSVSFRYVEEHYNQSVNYMSRSWMSIESINEVKKISVPNDLKPLMN